MAGSANRSAAVGSFVRQQVIPAGMTVTEAAKKLGIGRPALSNLLNGRAALSQDMALRLEATFGADRPKLLELQAAADRDRRRDEDRAVAVGAYVPDFLAIKARQIEGWAENLDARDLLPVLLRRLIHATGRELRQVDFPGYDNAQRHGSDGRVEADAATPWVPEGQSVWEFGVDQRPGRKAEQDYQARLRTLSSAERAECTFVFVTPRNWQGKVKWVRAKEAAGDWKAVKALDASDLEQWLETTIAPRIWLARKLGIPTEGFKTLDEFWSRWAEASDPPLTAAIFAPSVAAHVKDFRKWLEKEPGDRPRTVAADSRDEAVAFLACLLRHEDLPAGTHDRAVVFESASALRTLAGSSSLIPIVYTEEVEREIASLYRQCHCIVVRPRNAVDREPDIAVELMAHAAFEQALADMGIEQDRFDRLASESGRSPTVLRRRLSEIDAIRKPSWAGDEAVARRLIPMALVGAWHSGTKADSEVLTALTRREYDEVEGSIADLLQREDCPVWCVDQYRGVVSKIDALFAIRWWITAEDVTAFLHVAKCVLSESDPALELPEDQQWAAGLYGKVREHSSALRNGVCETLVMLSVHGNTLFRDRLGIDVASRVANLIKGLLDPFTSETLRSNDRDLPAYAEAAPDEFLKLLEEDLRQTKPVLLALLRPVGAGPFERPWRSGLLWALERLAWNPRNLRHVVNVLARLSQTKIDDNWVNRPINSLSSIFRWWLPQTAAPLEVRIKALEALCRNFPEIGWQICIRQFEGSRQIGHCSDRPRWRNDAAGAGRGVSGREQYEFARKALDLALSWPVHRHAVETLGDLVERIGNMEGEDQSRVWDVIDTWSLRESDEKAKTALRTRLRRAVLGRRGRLSGLDAQQRDRARRICDALASRDQVQRHAWLFVPRAMWEVSSDELDEDRPDWKKREKQVHELRVEAMAEIWSARGLEGALALLADCDAWTVGDYAARCAADPHAATEVLRTCLFTSTGPEEKLDQFMQGFLWRLDEGSRSTVISTLAETGGVDQIVRLFGCAPFHDQTWRLLDPQDGAVRDRYWQVVIPRPWRFSEPETTEVIDRLLEAGRPRAAFSAVQFDWNKVETSRLKMLLAAVVAVNAEPAGQFEIESWDLSEALDSLDGRPGVTVDDMARLEFACIDALVYNKHGIPNIERKIAESPSLFLQALALIYKRNDDGQDPPEWRVDDPERHNSLGLAAYRLLDEIKRTPGADDDDRVDARALSLWVREARRLCREHGRAEIGDEKIGQLLSRSPFEEDGGWPCRPVCEVLESIASEDIASGFEVGVYNGRGVVSRGLDEGGKQERELSEKYRAWAQRLEFDYPYVANILESIAKHYDRYAEREDSQVRVMKRLEH